MHEFLRKFWPLGPKAEDYQPTRICLSCYSLFSPNQNATKCDDCASVSEKLYVEITRLGSDSTRIMPIDQIDEAFDGEFKGARAGQTWTVTLLAMTPAEYDALPDLDEE